MSKKFMAGVAISLEDITTETEQRLQEAGLHWLRSGIRGFDQDRFFKGEEQPEAFYQHRQKLTGLRERGFEIMGITPGPVKFSEAAGKPGSAEYYESYRRLCAFLGREYQGLIDYWQVANELDIWIFRDTLSLEESVEFLKAGLRGLKDVDKAFQVGINITLFPSRPGEVDGNTDKHEGVFLAKGIYQDPTVEVDYAGFDSYVGTWRQGGVEDWNDYLDSFYELTGKPIIIQEFGYSSAGEMMTEEEAAKGAYPCEVKKWKFAWNGGHTPDVQAAFISESYRIFAQKPFVIGAIYYRWNDQATCWQCGQPDCPAETAWGLVTLQNELKPSYHSLKKSLATYWA